MINIKDSKIAVIGLGYVGLPIALEFSKKYPVIGYDIDSSRIENLKKGYDCNGENQHFSHDKNLNLKFSNLEKDLKTANTFIVTVPTPIDENKNPDISLLINACTLIAKYIKKGDIVIFESTVYPGATEEDCIPVIENISKMKLNEDFYAGYSPERINPGDQTRNLKDIVKVTSGSNKECANFVDSLYSSIITAGTYKASNIKIAEGSKIIENIQRDVNIALVNEFFQLFNNLGINTNEVIEAASTKWNFMKVKPGLVGGHCISVDPYYLLHKSSEKGFVPDLIKISREINNSMSSYLINDFLRRLIEKKINPSDHEIAILGFSFKENCPDIRNTKVLDLVREMESIGLRFNIYDPVVDEEEVFSTYSLKINKELSEIKEKILFIAVQHEEFLNIDCSKFEFIYDFRNL